MNTLRTVTIILFAHLVIPMLLTEGCKKKEQISQLSSEKQNDEINKDSIDVSLAERVFDEDEPFDVNSYKGMRQSITTLNGITATISLYIKKNDEYEKHAELEIKGKIVLGAEGILGYPETFLRIKLMEEEGVWKEIRKKAIKNGRLYIETEGDKQTYTIHGIHATQYTGIIETGIQLP